MDKFQNRLTGRLLAVCLCAALSYVGGAAYGTSVTNIMGGHVTLATDPVVACPVDDLQLVLDHINSDKAINLRWMNCLDESQTCMVSQEQASAGNALLGVTTTGAPPVVDTIVQNIHFYDPIADAYTGTVSTSDGALSIGSECGADAVPCMGISDIYTSQTLDLGWGAAFSLTGTPNWYWICRLQTSDSIFTSFCVEDEYNGASTPLGAAMAANRAESILYNYVSEITASPGVTRVLRKYSIGLEGVLSFVGKAEHVIAGSSTIQPQDLMVSDAGDIYYFNGTGGGSNAIVYKIDPTTLALVSNFSVLDTPNLGEDKAIYSSLENAIYICRSSSIAIGVTNAIQKYSLAGTLLATSASITSGCVSIGEDPYTGTIYTVNWNGRFMRINKDTLAVESELNTGGQLTGLHVDPYNGKLYAMSQSTTTTQGRIYVVDYCAAF